MNERTCRTERALAALKDLTAPRSTVIRGGHRQPVPAAVLVAGDVIVLEDGGRGPTDALLLEASRLEADESLLILGQTRGSRWPPPQAIVL